MICFYLLIVAIRSDLFDGNLIDAVSDSVSKFDTPDSYAFYSIGQITGSKLESVGHKLAIDGTYFHSNIING